MEEKRKVNDYVIEPYANLAGAKLTRANLTRADLAYANLTRAKLTNIKQIIDLGQRVDGWRHVAFQPCPTGEIIIMAGCRYLEISEARQHWLNHERGPDCPLCKASLAMIDHALRVAEIRGWTWLEKNAAPTEED